MNRYGKSITILTITILLLSLVAASYGIFSKGGPGVHEARALTGETVKIYGEGIYKNDSVSAAAQEIAQDYVTLLLGIPLLLASLFYASRGLFKGQILLAGTLGYFLYTYTSYTFLSMYNPFFLLYVALMSSSFFAFTLTMMSFDWKNIDSYFNKKMPVKFLGSFLIFLGVVIGLMWLGRLIPSLINGETPYGLEHYTTLVIQALDLGFVIPVAILTGILVLKRNPFGYLLASVITIKGFTMLTAITAMIIGMINNGVKVSSNEIIAFSSFNIVILYCLFIILKNIIERPNGVR
ncbi:MAG: hypothetical protein K0S34_187 [Bacillales bacterium]|jgi:hypothetical protein|nr:hypothetical protein [Bacillales bacterium]